MTTKRKVKSRTYRIYTVDWAQEYMRYLVLRRIAFTFVPLQSQGMESFDISLTPSADWVEQDAPPSHMLFPPRRLEVPR